MKTSIQKWGNSLALRIPKPLAGQVRIEQGSIVELLIVDDTLLIRPLKKTEYALDELLSGVSENNIHEVVNTGDPVGKEVW